MKLGYVEKVSTKILKTEHIPDEEKEELYILYLDYNYKYYGVVKTYELDYTKDIKQFNLVTNFPFYMNLKVYRDVEDVYVEIGKDLFMKLHYLD